MLVSGSVSWLSPGVPKLGTTDQHWRATVSESQPKICLKCMTGVHLEMSVG